MDAAYLWQRDFDSMASDMGLDQYPRLCPKPIIAVWFSCGAASAVALRETIHRYGSMATVRAVYNPVIEEDADNWRFLRDVEQWLDIKIERAYASKYPDASAETVWKKRRFMSAPQGAPCTQELKKRARQEWETRNRAHWHVLGFTAEEEGRHKGFTLTERENVLPVLIDAGLTKQDCIDIVQRAGIAVPRVYEMGYPNANCIGCVKATSPTYWNHVRQCHPETFQRRAELSREIGAKLVRVKGERIFLDELDPDARGRPLKSMDIECGVFCEEKPEF